MARWVVFASWREDDKALWNSHWVAQETIRRLTEPVTLLERELAVRQSLEPALCDPEVEGIALFGHGRAHAVFGTDGCEALDFANLSLVDGKWVHAFACLTGEQLVPAAISAEVFVGYRVKVIVEWDVTELPAELRERLARLVTSTTEALFNGVRTQRELQQRVAEAADELTLWLLENTTEGYLGIHVLAQQLIDRMVVGGRGVVVESILSS